MTAHSVSVAHKMKSAIYILKLATTFRKHQNVFKKIILTFEKFEKTAFC